MKNSAHKKFKIDKERIKKIIRQALSPAFLIILLGSFALWYMTKLSYDYTTEMPLNVRIDGQKYRVTAVVAGRGSVLMAQRLSLKSKINIKMEDLSVRQSRDNPDALTITPASLQKIINAQTKELDVKMVTDAPDFIPGPKKETRKEKRARERLEREQEFEKLPKLTE